MGILLASGGGALGVRWAGPLPVLVGEPDVRAEMGTGEPATRRCLPSAVGLVWRALIMWLLLILLITVAYIVP